MVLVIGLTLFMPVLPQWEILSLYFNELSYCKELFSALAEIIANLYIRVHTAYKRNLYHAARKKLKIMIEKKQTNKANTNLR